MPLEIATFVGQLNPDNPTGGEPIAAGDDHIRLIKTTLTSTFPNVKNEVQANAHDLDGFVPSGGIIMWSGALVPLGWLLCDGTQGTPDLRSKFIIGASDAYPSTSTGGAFSKTSSGSGAHSHTTGFAGSHSHTGATQAHALTIAQLPAHNHGGTVMAPTLNTGAQVVDAFDGGQWLDAKTGSDFTGSNQGHSHGINADGNHNHATTAVDNHSHTVDVTPPYYALAFIMRASPAA